MAFTSTKKQHGVAGGIKFHIYSVDFDSVTEGGIKTGMENVLFAAYSPKTSDDHGIVNLNFSDAGSTASRGEVFISAVTSDDEGQVIVFGV